MTENLFYGGSPALKTVYYTRISSVLIMGVMPYLLQLKAKYAIWTKTWIKLSWFSLHLFYFKYYSNVWNIFLSNYSWEVIDLFTTVMN
jgi:hypothetical protein